MQHSHQHKRKNLLSSACFFCAPLMQVEDLLAKTAENKAVNDRKRLATSYSNFARSRTVSDGTCKLPNNWFGCDIGAVAGDVKYVKDDIKLECEVGAVRVLLGEGCWLVVWRVGAGCLRLERTVAGAGWSCPCKWMDGMQTCLCCVACTGPWGRCLEFVGRRRQLAVRQLARLAPHAPDC